MILGKYNQSKTIPITLYEIDGIDLSVAATFAAGDVKIRKDEGAEANTTNLPTDEGSGYSLVLTATEMSAARIQIILIDQTGTKIWLDTTVDVESYGHASAEHEFDLDTANVTLAAATHTGAVIPTVTDLTNLPVIPANWLTAAGIAAGALDGKGNWNIGKTGYALSTAGILAVWHQLTAAVTTAGTVGKLILDNLNTTVSSRMPTTHIGATAGVVDEATLVGTTTLNTDMVAEAPTAVQNRQEMDANSTQLAAIVLDTGTTIDNHLTDIKGTGFVKDTHSLTDIEAYVDMIDDGTSGLAKIAADVADILVDTNELQIDDVPGLIAALNDVSTAQVLAQVNAALDTAVSELGVAAPAATPTLRTGMMLMYMALRNKTVVQTSGTDALEIHNDAGTKICSKALTDDGSDFTEAEMV